MPFYVITKKGKCTILIMVKAFYGQEGEDLQNRDLEIIWDQEMKVDSCQALNR